MKTKKRNLTFLGITAIIGLSGALIFSSFDDLDVEKSEQNHEEIPSVIATTHFDINPTGYEIEEGIVQKNEFLSTLLDRYGIYPTQVHELSEKSKDIFDVRRISAGNPYTVFLNTERKADYFVYQPNKIDYIVYDLRNGVEVRKGQKEVIQHVRSVAGTITSSLYQTLDELNVSPEMAIKLAEIYGWSVDFYRINKGDWFKIQYELQEVDGETVGSGKILSAVFGHQGREFEAYYFETDEEGKGTYYDEKGNSLRRAFLKAPLKYSRISSRYSPRRLHPVQKVWKAHLGTDFAAPTGTPILATGDGMVVASAYAGGNGNYVKIQHDNVYSTQYLHMSKRAVKRGQRVKQGEVIGYVGSTGLATGPHVCYRFWVNGKQVDPLKMNFPSAEPIGNQHQVAFLKAISNQRLLLAKLSPFAEQQENKLVDSYTLNVANFLANLFNATEDATTHTFFKVL